MSSIWKISLLTGLFLLGGLAILAYIAFKEPTPPTSQAFVGGQVITMDEESRVVEAVWVKAGKIAFVGSDEEVLAKIDNDTEIVDLNGRSLLPGFIDAHGHFPGTGISRIGADLTAPPVGKVTSIEKLQSRLRKVLRERGGKGLVFGFGYDDTLLLEKRHPTRRELDAVSVDQPVVIMHVSGHMLVGNTAALALAGIDRETPDPEGGHIGRDDKGELNGFLEETARLPLQKIAIDFSLSDILSMTNAAVDDYLSHGVTTAQAGAVDQKQFKALSVMSRLGIIPLRLVYFPFYDDWQDALTNGTYTQSRQTDSRLIAGPVKMMMDGSIQAYTGYLREPYHTPPDFRHGGHNRESDSDQAATPFRGRALMSFDELQDRVVSLHKNGYQMAIHGNGDAAIDSILEAFSTAQRDYPNDDPRLILVHAQMAQEDQLPRMKHLGVTPSFFSAHTWFWGDRHRDVFLGQQRAERISPTASASAQVLRYSVHLDSPVVPMRPLQALWSTVYRKTSSGKVLGEDQRVSVMQALRALTIDAAWQIFQESNIGSLVPGKSADLVVLDGDLLNAGERMRRLNVDLTIVGGVTVYERDEFPLPLSQN